MLLASLTNWLTSSYCHLTYIKCSYISLFFQDIDVDTNYKNYSLGVRKSLEAWSGSQIDLGLVCVCTLFWQINLYFINLIYLLFGKSLLSFSISVKNLVLFIWSRCIRSLNFFAAASVKVCGNRKYCGELCCIVHLFIQQVYLMYTYFNNCAVGAEKD